MATARNLLPPLRIRSLQYGEWAKLALPALIVTFLCGLGAFTLLVWRDHDHPKVMVNDQTAPLRRAVPKTPVVAEASSQAIPSNQPAAPGLASGGGVPSSALEQGNFNLTGKSPTVVFGTVKIRLLRTNSKRRSYDLSVQERGHMRMHHNLRLRQPLWIAGNRGEAPFELVVSAITRDSVTGYWKQAGRAPLVPGQAGKRQ